jgi:hypothetical protein
MLQLDDHDLLLLNRVRRRLRYRRPAGIICTVLGIVAFAALLYWMNNLRAQSNDLLNELGQPPRPTTQQMEKVADQARFNIGFILGFAMAEGLAAAASLAVGGLVLAFGRNRKDQLLLKCVDEHSAAQ